MLIKLIGLYAASVSTLASNIVLVILRKKRLKEVKLNLENKTKYFLLVFIYIFICQYINFKSYIIPILNILLAVIFFVYVNKNFMFKITKKLKKLCKNK